ncbi:hypothetical protein F2P81_020285 [Scophthalmus maximus]|uniref:Uncharacterized protein n=1 Tax=Scophthalmus maximus TaxID=52904 RepID=A0A6A4SA09_SCOMX|nr:hypothetical protein F2P81_020285 [Scophthalmus maximus]
MAAAQPSRPPERCQTVDNAQRRWNRRRGKKECPSLVLDLSSRLPFRGPVEWQEETRRTRGLLGHRAVGWEVIRVQKHERRSLTSRSEESFVTDVRQRALVTSHGGQGREDDASTVAQKV